MSLSLKIVHIGRGTTPDEINHIIGLRSYGHDVYIPGDSTHEQLIRRIIDADEIHIFDAGMVFELGMVYFFSVHALHYRLSWVVKWYCDGSALPVFPPPPQFEVNEQRPILDDEEAAAAHHALTGERPILLPPCERSNDKRARFCKTKGGCAKDDDR